MAHDLGFHLLRAFVTVADLKGFSAAAQALHITQPALSRRVAELEATLGLRLFHRTSRHVGLTQGGEDLLERCRDLLTHGETVRERARALAEGTVGTLRVGCAPMVMEAVVAPLIAQYRKRCPGVDLQLYEQGGERAQEAVLRGQLHAAIASPTEPKLRTRLLFPWRLLAVVPNTHPLAKGRTVDILTLVNEPILTLPLGFGTRALFNAGCETIGVRALIRMEAAAAHTLVAAAQAGYGVAIVPSVVRTSKRLVKTLPLLAAGKSLGRWLAIAWNAERPQPSYLAEFTGMLAGAMARDYPGHEYRFAPEIQRPASTRPRPGRSTLDR